MCRAGVQGSIEAIVGKIPRKWKNVQAIFLKTHDSAAIPIYASLPAQVGADDEEEAVEEQTKSVAKKGGDSGKKRKRSTLSTPGAVAKELKKAKTEPEAVKKGPAKAAKAATPAKAKASAKKAPGSSKKTPASASKKKSKKN